MRCYIPIAQIESRDPSWAARIRLRDQGKQRRQRAEDPERARATGRALYAKNPERYRSKTKAWKIANPQKTKESRAKAHKKHRAAGMLGNVRKACKAKSLHFDLTVEWIDDRLRAGVCEMSGLPFDLETVGYHVPNRPSIDRIEPGGPYTQANCRIVLWSINRALCNWGEDYLLGVFEKVLSRQRREA